MTMLTGIKTACEISRLKWDVANKARIPKRHAAWKEVRATFFPRWDRRRQWKLKAVDDLDGASGRSKTETKTIKVLDGLAGDDLIVVLIHEVAHAASSVHHGGVWEARMAKAAAQAEHLGRIELASRIRNEIVGYATCSWTPTASAVYQQISDATWDCPQATFRQVMDLVRRDYGLTREGFLHRFSRAAVVYEEAKAEALEHAKARAAMRNEKKEP